MLRYEHIEYLNLLFGIPLLIVAILIYNRWKKNALSLFGDRRLVQKLMYSFSSVRTKIKNIFTILIFFFLIIGIANPQIGTKMEEVKREGVDLIIAIDLSNSMMAEDIKPNRIERAKQAISKLIDNLKGDRIGLIVFAGEAYVQLPITTDYSAAKLFLSTVKTDIIPTQGTEIAKAINLSIESFDMENTQDKAIVIITDGESHDENAIENAKKANELGIIVHTLGMGLSKGGPIPIYNKYGNKIGFRKNKEGNIVDTIIPYSTSIYPNPEYQTGSNPSNIDQVNLSHGGENLMEHDSMQKDLKKVGPEFLQAFMQVVNQGTPTHTMPDGTVHPGATHEEYLAMQQGLPSYQYKGELLRNVNLNLPKLTDARKYGI